MGKMSLQWHRECVANQEAHFAQMEASLAIEVARLERARKDVEFARQQIAEAEARGLTAFDNERLLVKRK